MTDDSTNSAVITGLLDLLPNQNVNKDHALTFEQSQSRHKWTKNELSPPNAPSLIIFFYVLMGLFGCLFDIETGNDALFYGEPLAPIPFPSLNSHPTYIPTLTHPPTHQSYEYNCLFGNEYDYLLNESGSESGSGSRSNSTIIIIIKGTVQILIILLRKQCFNYHQCNNNNNNNMDNIECHLHRNKILMQYNNHNKQHHILLL